MFRHHRRKDDRFLDRWQAGRALGASLQPLVTDVPREDRIVLGLARGGVVVAAEVAATLEATLDAVVVRKIGSPYQPELAIGAVGPQVSRAYNRGLIAELGIDETTLENLTATVEQARDRLDRDLRGGRPLPNISGKVAILVDDGLATGASMRAALTYAHADAASVVVAVPVAAPEVMAQFEAHGVRTHALIAPATFGSVGSWYVHFDEVASDDVRALLAGGTVADV